MKEPADPDAPLRGPTFAVVAPTVGVLVVLVVLALRACAPAETQDGGMRDGGRLAPASTLELAAGGAPEGAWLP